MLKTWGRHRGEPLSALPTGYIRWLLAATILTLTWNGRSSELRAVSVEEVPAADASTS